MAVTIARTDSIAAGVAAVSTVATYEDVAIGTASADRVICVAVGSELASSGATACTIDGQPMTPGTQGNEGALFARIFYRGWPTGTTADIAVTFGATSPSETQNRIAVYAVTGGDGRPQAVGAVNDTDADPISSGAVTVPTGGGKLVAYAAATDTTDRTWTGTTESVDVDAGAFRFSTGLINSGGSITTTVSGGNNEDATLSYIVFFQSPTPVLPRVPDMPSVFMKKTLTNAVLASGLFWSTLTPSPPIGDGSVEWAAAQAIVPHWRTILYPSLQEPVPIVVVNGRIFRLAGEGGGLAGPSRGLA